MKKYRFSFISAYQGSDDYMVTNCDTREQNRISYRTSLNSYLKKWFNGTPEQYERDVVGSLYYITGCCDTINPEMVQAFREYMQQNADETLIHMRERAEKYKDDPELKAIYDYYGPATPLIRGGAIWNQGWVKI